jgi:predicted ATPase
MSGHDNPYAHALDGLQLADPVAAFFDFCRARERVRQRRRSGEPAPWTDDRVLAQGRFLNVFREDDRGTKAIFRFVEPVVGELPALVHALFFARWCNQPATLDVLEPAVLNDPSSLRRLLRQLPAQPWCNVTAYPVLPARWEGAARSRFDTATEVLLLARGRIVDAVVAAGGDVVNATRNVNALLQLDNDFPIFMAVMDLAWFRPDVIDPASRVPTGIGAEPYLNRLQAHLGLADHAATCDAMIALQPARWPMAKRALQPIDVEYIACECRKYYSYLNGTKQLQGKNVFRVGERPQLQFDIPQLEVVGAAVASQIHVIAGGPGSGKSTLVAALRGAGLDVVPETAEVELQACVRRGGDAAVMRDDPVAWQQHVLAADFELFDALPVDEPVFTDTSFIEDLVFAERAGLSVGPNIAAWLHGKRYRAVFYLQPLAAYEQTAVRLEDRETAMRIGAAVLTRYRTYGYEPILVPDRSVEERVAFVLAHVKAMSADPL